MLVPAAQRLQNTGGLRVEANALPRKADSKTLIIWRHDRWIPATLRTVCATVLQVPKGYWTWGSRKGRRIQRCQSGKGALIISWLVVAIFLVKKFTTWVITQVSIKDQRVDESVNKPHENIAHLKRECTRVLCVSATFI